MNDQSSGIKILGMTIMVNFFLDWKPAEKIGRYIGVWYKHGFLFCCNGILKIYSKKFLKRKKTIQNNFQLLIKLKLRMIMSVNTAHSNIIREHFRRFVKVSVMDKFYCSKNTFTNHIRKNISVSLILNLFVVPVHKPKAHMVSQKPGIQT